MKVYLASSWRNPRLDDVVAGLVALGHSVYDFRAQPGAFSWSSALEGLNPQALNRYQVLRALRLPAVADQFALDMAALNSCGVMVLALPAGRSAHLEAGYFAGNGKPVFTLLADNDGVDLMHLMLGGEHFRCTSEADVCAAVDTYSRWFQSRAYAGETP